MTSAILNNENLRYCVQLKFQVCSKRYVSSSFRDYVRLFWMNQIRIICSA